MKQQPGLAASAQVPRAAGGGTFSLYLSGGLAALALVLASGCSGAPSTGGVYPQPVDASPVQRPDAPLEPDDLAGLGAALKEGRLSGWIHGAVHDRGLYVFTYRKPQDFFSFAQFPVTPATPAAATQLQQLKRHDAVVIKGAFIDNTAPIRHIRLEQVTVVTPFQRDETPAAPHVPDTTFPDDLAGQTEAVAKVHAVDSDGRILVIEYGDAVVPVFVAVPALTAGLYRNDKIRLNFQYAVVPPRPTHLWLDTAHARPIEVLERLVDRHGVSFQAEGSLVRFQRSPEITIDVYAVQVVDADGVSREYTLLNNSLPIFTAIREKLAAAWNSRPGQAIDGRNKLVNPRIRVTARGTFNLVAPNQANAQILLDSADDVTVTLLP